MRIRQGLKMLRGGGKTPRLFHVDMSGTAAEDEGMVCGGAINVLLEAVG